MYIFPTYFAKRNFQSHFLRKFLKALTNKICDIMWDEKFQLKERSTVITFQRTIMVATCDAFGCTYSYKNIPDLSFSYDICCKCSKQMILTEMNAEDSLCSSLAER